MKNAFKMLAIALVAVSFFSCASLNAPVSATSNEMGSKVGQSSGKLFLHGMFGSADAGIQAAAKNGGITKISSVDFETEMKFAGIITVFTCTVTGE